MFANHTATLPRETRTLGWADARHWKAFVRELERDAGEGRWVGFIAYEALASEEDVKPREVHPTEPAAFFAWHERVAAPHVMQARQREHHGVIRDSLGNGLHRKSVERIRNCIRDGDVYQVNLTRSFEADVRVDAGELYAALTAPHPPQCSALVHGDGWAVVSASPEVMLRFDRGSGVAVSMPIKGTVKREGNDAEEIARLLGSAKDEAEHLMIVDVVRNDFGKVAPPGRVSVSEYRAVRTLDYVHHLESTVRAEGLQDASVADVLAALAPAASITGAPKRAAVQLIRELEPVPRGVYCGTIGTIDAHGAEMSVAIRTAVVTATSVRYHAGGGIVWDSDAAAEDDECRAKAAPFFKFLGGAPSTSA